MNKVVPSTYTPGDDLDGLRHLVPQAFWHPAESVGDFFHQIHPGRAAESV